MGENNLTVKIFRLWCFLKSLLSHPKSLPNGSKQVILNPRHACNENRPLTWLSLTSQWSLTVTHTVYSCLWNCHFSALSSSRPSAYLLRSIQQYDTATRAKESKNKETAPALTDRTTSLASSCCFVWIYLQCHMTISPYLSLNPRSKGAAELNRLVW